ncbi:cytidylyltransferase domain-containing protein [Oryzobacter terrae]|uniref:acylneuraminate cytidylyltransferase family protein n=1 Tax=Oryzobacter terrae TaxID=1620385 RepID=UPI00366FDF57
MTASPPTRPSDPRVLAVVPARGGSRGLPDKNVRLLSGLPLVVHAIRAAAGVAAISRTVVTTDSTRIADVAREHGGDVPFLRPAGLAADDTPMAPVIAHALATVEEMEGSSYDAVVLLDPTSPAREPQQVTAALEMLWADPALDGVVSVSEPTFQPEWVGVRHEGAALARYFPASAGVTRRQDTERYLRINGNFYVWRAASARALSRSWFDEGRYGGLEIPEAQAFSIDDEDEFRLIQALVDAGVVRLPWTEEDR